jgi:hypothetical protein
MRLSELEPRWYTFEKGGPRVGLTFLCPHCLKVRLGVVFHHRGHEAIDDVYLRAQHSDPRATHVWTLEGGEDFNTVTLMPSVDASKIGHWHGYITNGEIK